MDLEPLNLSKFQLDYFLEISSHFCKENVSFVVIFYLLLVFLCINPYKIAKNRPIRIKITDQARKILQFSKYHTTILSKVNPSSENRADGSKRQISWSLHY